MVCCYGAVLNALAIISCRTLQALVYQRLGDGSWQFKAYLSTPYINDQYGFKSMAMSGNGRVVVVGEGSTTNYNEYRSGT
jgi:hypothetical protein